MATFNFNLPEINQETLSDSRNIKAIYDALYMLNEQLRFTLQNLSIDENFDKDAAGTFTKIAKQIRLTVKKGEVVAEINMEDGVINLTGNRIIIDSDNFKVAQDGTITAVNGNFSGNVGSSGILSNVQGLGYLQIIGSLLLSVSAINGMTAKIQNGVFYCDNSANHASLDPVDLFMYTDLGTATHYALTYARINGANVITDATISAYVNNGSSDLRIKKDIITAPDKWLDVLKEVKVKEFTYKDNTVWGDKGQRHLGVIAQQLQKSLSDHEAEETDLIKRQHILDEQHLDTKEYTGGEDPLAVDYQQFIPMLILGYQRQQEQIEALEKEIEILKGGKEQ